MNMNHQQSGADRAEKADLAAAHPGIVERMKTSLEHWQESVIRSYNGRDCATK